MDYFLQLHFYGCSSSSNNKQSTSPSEKEDQTQQTSKSGATGYSSDEGELAEYVAPELVDGVGKKLLAIYMVGSDLEENGEAGTTDLYELIDGYYALSEAEQESLDIVVAFGGSNKDGWRGMRIATMAQILADDDADQIFGNGEYSYIAEQAHMGDDSSLELFLQFVKDGYGNHEQKVLTMWDHGSAYGSFGNDSNYDSDGLTMAEMESAFKAVGLEFDIIGYDACLNANFELASMTQNYARYHIGSEELEPGHGWNYEAVVPALAKNDDLQAYGKEIIDDYVKHDSHPYQSDGKTLSMVDLSYYGELKAAVDALATYVDSNLDDEDVKKSVIQSSVKAQQYGKSSRGDAAITIDLKGFSDGVATELAAEGKSDLTQAVNDAYNNYVIYAKEDGTRPNSNGVTIAPPQGYDDYNEDVASSDSWYGMTRSMIDIIADDSTSPTISEQDNEAEVTESDFEYYEAPALKRSSQNSSFLGSLSSFATTKTTNMRATDSVSGTRASFHDSNLASVKTVYGNIIEDDGVNYFASVATHQALKTTKEDEYFTPTWNQKWYIMYYGDSEDESTWLPLEFENEYTNEGVKYRTYSAEIDYMNADKDYSAYPEDDTFDYAKLSITVDENETVTLSSVRPYKIVYQSAEDETGSILYDKASYPLKAGDKIKLLAEYFNMDTFDTEWFYESDVLEITQTPEFELQTLIFENDSGDDLDYYYMMIGTDIGGNWVNTEPAKTK